MATIRNCFLIDSSLCNKFEVIYTDSLKNIQDQLSKYRWCYIQEAPDMTNKVVYTSDIIMDLKKTISQFRKVYIPPNIPKLVVNS